MRGFLLLRKMLKTVSKAVFDNAKNGSGSLQRDKGGSLRNE